MIETRDQGARVTWAGAVLNLALGVAKGVVGILAGSRALLADGIHSLADLVSDVVVLLSLRMARAERDAEHPYGHGRIEAIGSAVLGIILLIVAGGILWDGVAVILAGSAPRPGAPALALAAASILLKEVLYRVTVSVGRRIGSDLLVANAWHHRSDALSSVAALVGVGGAMLGPTWLDPAAALVVAILVGGVGVGVLRSAVVNLIDTAVPEETRRVAESIVRETPGVLDAHDLLTRRTGRGFHMEVHVEVDAGQTVVEGHDIARSVRDRMFDRFPDVLDVVVHVDPWPADRFDTERPRRDAPGE